MATERHTIITATGMPSSTTTSTRAFHTIQMTYHATQELTTMLIANTTITTARTPTVLLLPRLRLISSSIIATTITTTHMAIRASRVIMAEARG